MSLAEIDEEFRRMRKLLEEGRAHFEAREFEKAQTVLFGTLKLMDTLKVSASADKIEALEKLADAYYAQKQFIESRAVYQQLNATIQGYEMPEPEDRSRILFKLARSTDQVQDFENASKLFAEAMSEGEDCMVSGAPLLTEIYEAHSSLLRRARLDPDQLIIVERKARASRQKQAGITESLFDPVDEEKRRRRREEEEAYYQSLSKAQKFIHLARKHPLAGLAICFSPVMIAVAGLALIASLALMGIDIGFTQALSQGEVYSTPDSALQIVVESPTSAQIKSTKTFPVKIRNLNRWSELINSMNHGQGRYWLQRTPDRLIGEDGVSFFKSDSTIMRAQGAMQQLGTAMFKHSADGKTTSWNDITQLSSDELNLKDYEPDIVFRIRRLASPYSGKNAKGKTVEDLSASQFLSGLENGASTEFKRFFPPEVPFSGETPLSIVCFVHKNAIGIVALDFSGHRMKTTDGSRYLLCSSANPSVIPPRINGPEAQFIPHAIGRTELLIADRSKEDVQKKYFHLFLSMMLLLILVPMGVMLVQRSKQATVQFDYYVNPDSQRFGDSLWWITFGCTSMFYLAYLAWILFV